MILLIIVASVTITTIVAVPMGPPVVRLPLDTQAAWLSMDMAEVTDSFDYDSHPLSLTGDSVFTIDTFASGDNWVGTAGVGPRGGHLGQIPYDMTMRNACVNMPLWDSTMGNTWTADFYHNDAATGDSCTPSLGTGSCCMTEMALPVSQGDNWQVEMVETGLPGATPVGVDIAGDANSKARRWCYTTNDCTGQPLGGSIISEDLCKTLGGESWGIKITGPCKDI